MVKEYKDSNGEVIKPGDILVYITSNSMSDMEIFEKDGDLYGEGPFNTHPLSVYFDSLDFKEIHISKDFKHIYGS